MKERILILGGTYFQLPAVLYSQNAGYYVITCDYLPDNPAHKYADEYYNVSTTDKDAVLELAKKLKINGILCFASDPAAITAAYVSEVLGLPGNSLSAISTLAEKHLWRSFLSKNKFNTPTAISYKQGDLLHPSNFKYPVIVKPIDSSGSKGVSKVDNPEQLEGAIDLALQFSRAKRVIIEDYIERKRTQIGGDGFYGDDQLLYLCLGDQVVDNSISSFVPCGMTFPANIDDVLRNKIHNEVERAIRLSGLTNLSFNLEVMIDKNDIMYIMEIGPRNGGNCIPEVINDFCGIDPVKIAVEAALGHTISIPFPHPRNYHAYYALHASNERTYKGYVVKPNFKGVIHKEYIFKKPGDVVGSFNGSNNTIGVLTMEFQSQLDMETFFNDPKTFISLL